MTSAPSPHPYLRQHLLHHARAGHRLTDAAIPRAFLPFDESDATRPAFGLPVGYPSAARNLAAWAALCARAPRLDPRSRAASIGFHALPGPGEGDTQTGWQDWRIDRNILCEVTGYVTSVAVTSNTAGTALLAVMSGKTVQVWDLNRAQLKLVVPAEHQATGALALGTDAEGWAWLAVVCADGNGELVEIWDLAEGTLACSLLEVDAVGALAFCTDQSGRLSIAIGTGTGAVALVAVVGEPRDHMILDQKAPVTALASGPGLNGAPTLAVGDARGSITLLDPLTGDPLMTFNAPPRRRFALRQEPVHGVDAVALAIADGGAPRLAESRDGLLRVWDLATGALVTERPGGRKAIAVSIDDDTTLLAFDAQGGAIGILDPLDGSEPYPPIKTDARWIAGLAATASGPPKVASCNEYGQVRIWDTSAVELAGRPETPPRTTAVGFGRADHISVVAAATPQSMAAHDPANGATIWSADVDVLAFGNGLDGRLLAVGWSSDDGLSVFDLSQSRPAPLGPPVKCWQWQLHQVAVGLAREEQVLLASANEGHAELWDPLTATLLSRPVPSPPCPVEAVTLGNRANGECLMGIALEDRSVIVLEVHGNRPTIHIPNSHNGNDPQLTIGAAPDGTTVLAIAARLDPAVHLWNADTGVSLGSIDTLGQPRTVCLGAGPFQSLLAIGGHDGLALVPLTHVL